MKKIELAVSMLSADFSNLTESIRLVEDAGADLLHIDVMDGRFVPNITFGPAVVDSLKGKSKLPLDIHLMIAEPERHIDLFNIERAEYIVIHEEACIHLERTLRYIKSLGIKCGVAINPSTSPLTLDYVLDFVDQILVMSVNPGFAAQSFIPSAVEKIKGLDALRSEYGFGYKIAVDGGINVETIGSVCEAGADIIISGSAIFGAKDPSAAVRKLKEIADENAR
jgi:ribulose-phosphate 3-epimerase